MKRFNIPFAVTFIVILLTCYITFAKTSDSYIVGIYENPPLVFTENGVPKGFLVDLLTHIGQKRNLELTFLSCEWPECMEGLRKGSIDLLLPVAFSPQRAEDLDFGEVTVFTNWGELYCSRDFRLNSLLDLKDKTVAVMLGDIYEEAFKRMVSDFQIGNVFYIPAKDYEDVFRLIQNEKAKCGVASRIAGFFFIEQYRNVYRTPISFHPTELRIAATKGKHNELLKTIDNELHILKADADSIYHELLKRWIFKLPETDPGIKWILLGLSVILLILLILLGIFNSIISKKTNDLKKAIKRLKVELQTNEKLRLALEEEKQLKKLLIDNLQAGIIVTSNEGKIFLWNLEAQKWIKNLGDATKETLLWELFPGMEFRILKAFENVLDGSEARFEWECEKESSSRIARISLRSVVGQSLYILVLIEDITELKDIAKFYEHKWSFLQKIVDKMPLPLFIINTEGKVIIWNEASETITGLYKNEVLHKPLDLSPLFFGGKKILIPAILLMQHEPEEIERLTNGKIKMSADFPETVETTGWIWSKEEKRYVKILASRLKDNDGNIVGYFQCARDITDEINLQRTLAEAQKAETISHLTSAFTHELNNLLTIILGVCDMLSLELDKAPQIESYLSIIRDTVQKGSILSNYFQKMGRRDESYIEKRSFDTIVQDILNPLMPLLHDFVTLTCNFDAKTGAVYIRRSEFESIIFRLLVVDREELSLPRNIVLETKLEKRQIALVTPSIRIPPGNYAVLSITYMASSESHNEGKSLSVGDYEKITKSPEHFSFPFINRLVEQAGGYITIDGSEHHVKVNLFFPVVIDNDRDQEEGNIEILKGKTFFILEDDRSLMNVIKTSLRLYGADVIETFTLEEAGSKWQYYKNTIDLVILDLILPEGTSKELFHTIKSEFIDMPVVFISGYDRASISEELEQEEVVFLQKPFTILQLTNTVVKLFSRCGRKWR